MNENAEQIKSAYRLMAKQALYRPTAPGDGFGNIIGPLDLEREAQRYLKRWWADENKMSFFVGCCDGKSRPATIFAIEAARMMCCGSFGNRVALRLLKLAVAEMERICEGSSAEAQ